MNTYAHTPSVPWLDLNDGNRIPQLGVGVFRIPPEGTTEAVLRALRTGFRLIDTAASYRNETAVGEAIRRSGVGREEVFITTKLSNYDHGRDAALRAFERSLKRIGGDYVDLYLIHWPLPDQNRYVETWRALTELKRDGRVRSIGVANFEVDHLERIVAATGALPAVNQIELHPRLQQAELRRYHAERDILTEAWSPLGAGRCLDDPTIREVAGRQDRTTAQVVLRWHLQLGNVAIPKSVRPERIDENSRVFDFKLSDEDMRALSLLDAGQRTGPNPATHSRSHGIRGAIAKVRDHYPAVEPLAHSVMKVLTRRRVQPSRTAGEARGAGS